MCCHDEASIARWFPDAPEVEWEPLKASGRVKRLAVELPSLQARLKPDIAHFNYICPLRKVGPWINVIHDLLFLDYPQYFPLSYRVKNSTLFRISALRSEKVITSSRYSCEAIHRHFDIPLDRIHVVPAAPDAFVDAADQAIAELKPGRFVVYVSRFEPRKNQHALVRAFHDLETELAEDLQLVLVGSPALPYAELDEALTQADARVRVLSNLSHAQLTWLYRHAAASIYPSHAEGFGMPIIEAVAAGGRSYCAKNTAMSELVPFVHGSFAATEQAQICDSIRKAFGDYAEAEKCAVRDRMLATFNWDASAEALIDVLRD